MDGGPFNPRMRGLLPNSLIQRMNLHIVLYANNSINNFCVGDMQIEFGIFPWKPIACCTGTLNHLQKISVFLGYSNRNLFYE